MTEQPKTVVVEAPARFRVAEFSGMLSMFDELGLSVELDHGAIVRMNLPYYPHSRAVAVIRNALAAAIPGMMVFSELAVRIGDDTVRAPDVAVLADPGAESGFVDATLLVLAIEVSNSSLAYDLNSKARDYAAASIADYWVFDINERQVHRLSDPCDDGYASVEILPFGAPLTAACLPGPLTLAL